MEIDFEKLRVACKYKSECGYHCYAEGNYAKPCLLEKNCPLRQEPTICESCKERDKPYIME